MRTDAVEALVGAGRPPAPYPLQLEVTRPIHRAGLEADDPSQLFVLAGQGAALVREAAAADLVESACRRDGDVISRLGGDPSG